MIRCFFIFNTFFGLCDDIIYNKDKKIYLPKTEISHNTPFLARIFVQMIRYLFKSLIIAEHIWKLTIKTAY